MRNYVTPIDSFFDFLFPVERKNNHYLEDFNNNDFFFNNMMNTDIVEKKHTYEMKIDLPLVKKEDIKISIEDGNLVVSALVKNENSESDKGSYLLRERSYGNFSRSYYIGEEYNLNDLSAKLDNGVLTIYIPKKVKEEKKQEYLSIA